MTTEQKLIENQDFYWNEEGFMVLTEDYLRRRGYCCHQGCRHCPYEEETVKDLSPIMVKEEKR